MGNWSAFLRDQAHLGAYDGHLAAQNATISEMGCERLTVLENWSAFLRDQAHLGAHDGHLAAQNATISGM